MSLVHKVKDIKVTKKSNNLYLIESEIEFDKSFGAKVDSLLQGTTSNWAAEIQTCDALNGLGGGTQAFRGTSQSSKRPPLGVSFHHSLHLDESDVALPAAGMAKGPARGKNWSLDDEVASLPPLPKVHSLIRTCRFRK